MGGVDIMVVRELCGDVYFGKPAGIYTDDAGVRWGQNNMIYSKPEIERIARVAMDVAQKRQGRCCSIDKANVLDVSQLWKDVVIRVHGECGQGDEPSMLVGSLGMLPSASLPSEGPGVFEPIHGSAPDIAGTDAANPLAMILSAAMMCQYDLLQPDLAKLLEDAVEAVLDAGYRTRDIVNEGNADETLVGCK